MKYLKEKLKILNVDEFFEYNIGDIVQCTHSYFIDRGSESKSISVRITKRRICYSESKRTNITTYYAFDSDDPNARQDKCCPNPVYIQSKNFQLKGEIK